MYLMCEKDKSCSLTLNLTNYPCYVCRYSIDWKRDIDFHIKAALFHCFGHRGAAERKYNYLFAHEE